jgi:dynein heavy chain, axonemal
MENTMKQIEAIRDQFVPVANRVSRLFFVLTDLINVNDMYQYSLEFFRLIYEGAIKSVEGVIDKASKSERKAYFISEFTWRLYKNVCRSLFEKDKLLFSWLICLKIMDEVQKETGGLDFVAVRFLMAGATQVDMNKPNPTGDGGWLSDKAWLSMLEMSSTFSQFKGFDDDFCKNLESWEKIYNSQNPEALENIWPGKWQDLTILNRTIIISILRADKVVQCVQMMVAMEKELGEKYLTPPAFDMEAVFNDSTNKQPIIIVLSAGADPMTDIRNLSVIKKIKYESLSLGAGQAQKACNAIRDAQKTQQWVILQNCHLAPSFMPTLDGLIEEIVPDPSSAFRIWLTTMPSDQFPVTIVQNSVKVTAEPPKGLRNNIRGSFMQISDEELDNNNKPIAFRRLLWGLCFFNALCLERRKFGPLGWNIPYEFSASDLRISKDQLAQFLNFYDEIPYEALIYMVAEANYGGRVTDPQDRRCISLMLSDFYCNDMISEENHKLSETGAYFVPSDGNRDDYIKFIEDKLPMNDLTEVFGMHDNAEITSAINVTRSMLATALTMQPRVTSAAGKSQDQVLDEACEGILSKLPKNFDIEYAGKRHPITYEESMNTVLLQEILRFNRLLSIVRSSLVNIKKAILGEVVMSTELEAVGNSIFDNKTPAAWMKRSYPSLKPLASYVVDFVERLEFMQKWIDESAPPSFWLSGFFFTQSFLTGIKQNYARKYVIPIDEISMDFEVFNEGDGKDKDKAPGDGAYVYGMFLEGSKWDYELNKLQESAPKTLFTKMPYIWVKPAKQVDINFVHTYKCPVYKTLDRRGTLSTTGHSTNFVLFIELPMQDKHDLKHWVKRGVALVT